jgi:predicted ribosomally synthesized peptide with SipW-like signal peptide
MKLKNILLSGLSLVLVAALAIGGTVAYLQDDDSDVNVMTLGNVSIEQHEYERVVNADGTFATDTIDGVTSYVLKDFTQGKDLLPIVGDPSTGAAGWDNTVVRMTQVDSYGSMQVFAGKNAQDKFVTVENTGKTDAYVRTLVAIEVGSTDGSLVGSSYHQTWTNNPVGTIEIDGNNYYVTEYVYAGGQLSDGSWRHGNGILPAGDTSYPSLSQVYIKSSATNEDMEKIDGNGNGTLDILVLSQAVQAAGFDNAEAALNAGFGDITTDNHPWADGVKIPAVVEDAKDLDAALNAGDDVILNANLSFSSSDTTANSGYGATGVSVKGSTLDGAGHSLGINNWGTWDAAVHTTGGTIKNLTINSGMRGIFMGSATEDVYIDNVVIDGTVYTFNSDGGNKNYGVYISNSTLNGWTSHSDVHKEVVYTNCIFGEGSGYAYCRPYGPTTFVGCDFEAGFTVEPLGAVTFENCTIGGVPLTDANIDELVTDTANVTVK